MFESHQRLTGTQYTGTVAALCGAFIFSPALLLIASPRGYVDFLGAFTASLLCLVLARTSWKRAQLSMPTLEVQRP